MVLNLDIRMMAEIAARFAIISTVTKMHHVTSALLPQRSDRSIHNAEAMGPHLSGWSCCAVLSDRVGRDSNGICSQFCRDSTSFTN